MARSRSNALGLMQIKADTAGRDYFTRIKGYAHTPNSAYLYQPAQNIEISSGALPVAINPIEIITHPPTGLFFQSRPLAQAVRPIYVGGSSF